MLYSTAFANINFFWFFYFWNHVFMEEKDNPVEKFVINEGKLDGIDIDGN